MLVRAQKTDDEVYAWMEISEEGKPSIYYYAYTEDELKLSKKARTKVKDMKPVVKIAAWWVDKDIKVSCNVANTMAEKREGLQSTPVLEEGSGLFFPYKPSSDVMFHQGDVTYPLDLIFIRNDEVVKVQENTVPGSKDTWGCSSCDGVLEVTGGFCSYNGVSIGDSLSLIGLTAQDLKEFEIQKESAFVDDGDPGHQTSCGKGYCPDVSLNLLGFMSESLL